MCRSDYLCDMICDSVRLCFASCVGDAEYWVSCADAMLCAGYEARREFFFPCIHFPALGRVVVYLSQAGVAYLGIILLLVLPLQDFQLPLG